MILVKGQIVCEIQARQETYQPRKRIFVPVLQEGIWWRKTKRDPDELMLVAVVLKISHKITNTCIYARLGAKITHQAQYKEYPRKEKI
jgi:hypothetical protein